MNLSDVPLTTTQLLDRLKNGQDAESWRAMDAMYRPVLEGFARALGLSGADAEDAAQWAPAVFSRLYLGGAYQRGQGRLRSWIIGIARNRVKVLKRAEARRRRALPAEVADDDDVPADEATLTRLWDREVEREAFARAWRRVQTEARFAPEALRAFEMTAVRGLSAADAASACGLSLEAVYVAKTRVTRRVRELAEEITRRYTEDS